MLVPSKFTRLEESTLFRMTCVLSNKNDGESVQDVYHRTRDVFLDASEFLHALDVLFVLGVLDIDVDLGRVLYA
ncbi:ABC-three component system middle component 7 [Alcaligenes aquatilis]|uniref:ABC-three component system middle component 7 n=1 Tax=Alcaligenes aquatilis TaxID=323284 RepID=UPI000F6730D1